MALVHLAAFGCESCVFAALLFFDLLALVGFGESLFLLVQVARSILGRTGELAQHVTRLVGGDALLAKDFATGAFVGFRPSGQVQLFIAAGQHAPIFGRNTIQDHMHMRMRLVLVGDDQRLAMLRAKGFDAGMCRE